MLASDFITVDWITADHHGSFADNVAGDPSTHEVSVWIDARTIARGIREGGNTINVQYHFHRGTLPYESVIVPLRLLPLTGLPTPTIEGISGPILDFFTTEPHRADLHPSVELHPCRAIDVDDVRKQRRCV